MMKAHLGLLTMVIVFANAAIANSGKDDFKPDSMYGKLPCIASQVAIGDKKKIVFINKQDELMQAYVPACKITPLSSSSLDPNDLADKISKVAGEVEARGEALKSRVKSPVIETAAETGSGAK